LAGKLVNCELAWAVDQKQPFINHHICMLVSCVQLFSPGAGKSTIPEAAFRTLNTGGEDGSGSKQYQHLYLDLDVCVPQWMRVRCFPSFSS